MSRRRPCPLVALALSAAVFAGTEPPSPATGGDSQLVAEGTEETDHNVAEHLLHGRAFHDYPRQRASLMEGTGAVRFTVTTNDTLAQAFVNQGVGQLHGFWYYEAERSFREAAAIDSSCAMAWWGQALANVNHPKRAAALIAEAVKRREGVSDRERRYIAALAAYIERGSSGEGDHHQQYAAALEEIARAYPADLDAKAFLALQLWLNHRRGRDLQSPLAVDALLAQVLAREPLHPCHHYRIHLWENERPEMALTSAEWCGPCAPAIAHMWHMPGGHVFWKFKRFSDAAWYQEAAARVDHAYMLRTRVHPDRIHNYVHNNEWLVRSLLNVGRVRDAIELAVNLIEVPRHPELNTLEQRGSAHYGRLRLWQALVRYELWDMLIALAGSPCLDPAGETPEQQLTRLRFLAIAHLNRGDVHKARPLMKTVEGQLRDQLEFVQSTVAQAEDNFRAEHPDAANDADQVKQLQIETARPYLIRTKSLLFAVNELRGHLAVALHDYETGLLLLKKYGRAEPLSLARAQLDSGDAAQAERTVREYVAKHENEVQPLAQLVEVLWQARKTKEAAQEFERLRTLAANADLDVPVLTRLAPVARSLGYPSDWRVARPPPGPSARRPDLDSLGPFCWRPPPAPPWELADAAGTRIASQDFRGSPVVLLFDLGFDCLHCAEQLQVFGEQAERFREAGVTLIAITADTQERLRTSLGQGEGHLHFPIFADPQRTIFKAYGAYDEFEDLPLHATFVIDNEGLIRWHDVGDQPFMNARFVLDEARRLIAISKWRSANRLSW